MSFVRIIKKNISGSLNYLPFSILFRLNRQKLLLPFYHIVNNDRVPHIANLYEYKNVKQFEEDLNFLEKHFSPISLTDLVNCVKFKKQMPNKSFLLSFDDCYREVIEVIVPILRRRSLPAVFFLNTAFLDNKEMFYRNKASLLVEKYKSDKVSKYQKGAEAVFLKHNIKGSDIKANILSIKYHNRGILDELAEIFNIDFKEYLRNNNLYLSSSEVAVLVKEGFAIGSHSIDHPLFSLLSPEEQIRQASESLNLLRKQFDMPFNAFAFPFNSIEVSKDFYEQTHFNGDIDISFGTSGFQKGYCENNFQRQSMEVGEYSAKKIYVRLLRDLLWEQILTKCKKAKKDFHLN